MRKVTGGFTLVETVMFLAISSTMFVAALAIFGDKQSATEFSQSVREFESALNDTINDTSTGVFPDVGNVLCDYSGGEPVFSADAGARSGDNNQCLFVGKLIQLGDVSDDEKFFVHTVIGDNDIVRATTGAIEPEYDLDIHALYSDTGPTQFDTSEEFDLKWGTRIKHAFYTDSGGTVRYVWAVGILYDSFGSDGNVAGSRSGAASVALYAITPDNADAELIANAKTSRSAFRASVSSDTDRDFIENLQSPITICLEGGAEQEAAIEVGKGVGGLTATVNFNPPVECETP